MQVHQILRSKPKGAVITVTPGTRVADAARLLAERRIGAVVVSADGKAPLGILSERDIVRDLGRRGSVCLDEKVDALMTRNLISCAPADSADAVLEKMTAGRFRHMPVMDGAEMVGIISIGDVVAARIAELAMEKDALAGMIMGN
ncbi:MAG: CBS domain-containing protein [Albidovulum sp.]|jgi:CBS domain-containing protein|uniref:CBS domain-containing protein n=1 Tax=Albidovulum sp. TaxID=1872424 RepID=UPI0013257E6B|nr:CBS domain-containing protein [Defluviimonas sp.]KAB2885122.1 MAG: CBS domain-containing protein [Defluviimonas sp.]